MRADDAPSAVRICNLITCGGGALANLDHEVSDQTVGNILKEHGVEPARDRERQTTWKVFLKAHWDVLAAIAFTTIEVWTTGGLVTYYLLFVMELKTRRVHMAACTATLGDDSNCNGQMPTSPQNRLPAPPEFRPPSIGLGFLPRWPTLSFPSWQSTIADRNCSVKNSSRVRLRILSTSFQRHCSRLRSFLHR